MKQTILILVLIFFSKNNYAQTVLPKDKDAKINYTEVVKVDSVKKSTDLFKAANEFFSTNLKNFHRSNSEKNFQGANMLLGTPKGSEQIDALFKNDKPISLADKEESKIIARVINKYTGGTMGCLRILYFEYDMILNFKDGRYKYEITNFNYTHYNQAAMVQSQIYGFNDSGPCNSKNTLENLEQCDKCKNEFQTMYSYLEADTQQLISDMKNALNKEEKSDSDDW